MNVWKSRILKQKANKNIQIFAEITQLFLTTSMRTETMNACYSIFYT